VETRERRRILPLVVEHEVDRAVAEVANAVKQQNGAAVGSCRFGLVLKVHRLVLRGRKGRGGG
jgi:hypothetical protein